MKKKVDMMIMMGGKPEGESEVSFPVPAGFTIPEGVKPGDSFDAVASFDVLEDGSLSVSAIEGVKIGGEVEEDEMAEEENMSLGDAVARGMSAPQGETEEA